MQNTGFLKILPYYKSIAGECQHIIFLDSKIYIDGFLTRKKSPRGREIPGNSGSRGGFMCCIGRRCAD